MQLLGRDDALHHFSRRGQEDDATQRARVQTIIQDVRAHGDEALRRYSEELDGIGFDDPRVSQSTLQGAEHALADDLKDAIRLAATRIRDYHQHQPKEGFLQQGDGGLLGQLVRPLERVACYVPGGDAPPLFSTLLMTAIPAQVAGVSDIVVATPPRPDGSIAPEILFSAHTLGLSTLYRMAGAQAVAALAYGTPSIPKVDKIVGPGSIYTVLAKQAVYGDVGIEALPGPTETLVLADDSADPRHVAADLLAQAEHAFAQPVLVTASAALVEAVQAELARQLRLLTTERAARESLEQRGLIVLVDTLAEGVEVANAYAPEHLCILTRDPWLVIPQVRNAGGLFIGSHSLEALGDYLAGPSHVMPTGGTARFSSAVNVRDFQKVIPLVNLNHEGLVKLGPAAARMARAEGLEAHAKAIESRLD